MLQKVEKMSKYLEHEPIKAGFWSISYFMYQRSISKIFAFS